MRTWVTLTEEQAALEKRADEMLRSAPMDPERPAYTERQLARHGYNRLIHNLDLPRAAAVQTDIRGELQFLASISRLQPFAHTCLRLWIDGWTQTEMARTMGISQAEISRQLRAALRICYDNTPISFRAFSRHTTYRRPAHVRKSPSQRRCIACGEIFLLHTGEGRFCGSDCRRSVIFHSKRVKNMKKGG